MGRLIGYMANRSDRLAETLTEERAAVGDASALSDAWGIGFYQGGEVLHKKRPKGGLESHPLEWKDVAGNVRSDCAVLHFRHATVGDYRAENTHPFRMRQWLFAHDGTVQGFDAMREALMEPMPDFLRRNVRGTTDSEHVFHALLAFLHDGGQLDNPEIDPKFVLSAIRSTVSLVDRLVSEVGAPEATLNFILTNGRHQFGVRRGGPMQCIEREVVLTGRGASSSYRYAMLVSNGPETPPDWTAMKAGEIAVIGRDLQITTASL